MIITKAEYKNSITSGEKNAYKDFVDCLRYLMLFRPEYVTDTSFAAKGGGTY